VGTVFENKTLLLNRLTIGEEEYEDRTARSPHASIVIGPFREFYTTLLTKGLRPEMARLTLARKIATIVLIVCKRDNI
jgi:hypothetical protein